MMNSTSLLEAVVRKLDRGGSPDRRFPDRGGEYWALCPFHPDKHPENFSVSEAGYHCFACGASGGLWPLAEKLGVIPRRDASPASGMASGVARVHACTRAGGVRIPPPSPSTPVNPTGGVAPHAASHGERRLRPLAGIFEGAPCGDASRMEGMAGGVARVHACGRDKNTTSLPATLENYAAAKRLPMDFLASLGLTTVHIAGSPAVKMPYFDRDGAEIGARLRIALEGRNRFRWRKGSHVQPYGLWRLDRSWGSVILCEGESDAQTFWYHGVQALGVPGAANWQAAWAECVEGLTVYVWQEPDAGGDTFSARVAASLPDCLILTPPEGRKDISECYIASLASANDAGSRIPELVEKLRREARPWREIAAERLSREAAEAKAAAGELAEAPDILERFAAACRERGLVGEDRTAKLLFLAGVSRLLERPVSCVVKGASSSGKSVTVETVFEHFPQSAYYALSSMSERSLAYSNEPLTHRTLILYEAAGLTSELASYLIRSLLSEGKIRYETVEKTSQGLKPRLIERAGPTGLIVTTTGANLHPENETRMLSLTVRDDPLQTAGVLRSLADRASGAEPELPDIAPWHALQRWLELAGCREVTIPYAQQLALLADARAVRLRRDFGAVLNLVRAHAMLHQASRQRDPRGRILATLSDYAAVYELVIDLIAQGVQAMVSAAIRETVAAVKELDTPKDPGLHITAVAKALGIDRSAASRRVRVAIEDGYLTNLEERRGRPARITLGDPLPEERAVLPPPDALAGEKGGWVAQSPQTRVHACTRSTQAPEDDRAGLPPNPASEAEGSSGGRPAEPALADEADRAGLGPWQQSILEEFDL
jgi:hypothetical protein